MQNVINKNSIGKLDVFFEGMIIGVLSLVIFCSTTGIINFEPQPTAMDVYQGKTTLEYKMVDGVRTDSMVIFKNE